VADLVLEAVQKRGTPIEIVEWPGGEPRRVSLEVSPSIFRAVRGGRRSIPLGDEPNLTELAGLPWCSVLSLRQGERQLHRVVGPALHQTTGWVVPILSQPEDPSAGLEEIEKAAAELRRGWGLNRRRNEAAG
jgi:hypothetical protein